MRVLILSHDKTLFMPGSPSQQRMTERGTICDALFLLAAVPSGVGRQQIAQNVVAVPAVAASGLSKFLALWREARRIVKEERIDLIVSQDPFELGTIARNVARKYHIAWTVELHGDFYSNDWWKWHSGFLNWLRWHCGKRVLTSAPRIRAVSERIRKSLVFKLGLPDSRVSVFPVETAVTALIDAPPSPYLRHHYANFNVFLLTVGTLAPVKNIALQIKALAGIIKRYPKTALVIAGDGPDRALLEALAIKLKVSQNVVFVGQQKDLTSFYLGADVFLLTSHAEAWGRAAVEAMAAGLPVVMTDAGLAGELLQDGKSGLVIPVNDNKSLVSAIERLLEDSALRIRLGNAARDAVRTLPSHEEWLKRYKDEWEHCIATHL